MSPIRLFLLLVLCLFIIGVAIGRGRVHTLVHDSEVCLIPLSPRQLGMDPYDPVEFARYALSMMGQGDIVGQSYVCWPKFVSKTSYPPNLLHLSCETGLP